MGQPASLTWGVKQSFRNYVQAAGGAIETSGRAERLEDGAFQFAAGSTGDLRRQADGGLAGAANYLGEIAFEAHGGMLRVRLADPSVEFAEGQGVLIVADGGSTGPRLKVAKLNLTAMSEEDGELVIPTALTIEGSQVLGDHYPPGTALDPVRLRLDV